MSSPVFDGRRAERLSVLLDEASGRRRHHRRTDLDDELGELVRLAGRVGGLSTAPEPDPEFRDGLRSMLLTKIEREGIGVTATEKAKQAAQRAALAGKTQPVRRVPARTGRARAAVLLGVTAGALALSGVSAASTESLPGDALYQVKRSSERAQLALAGSEEGRGHLYLQFAASRLDEAVKLRAAPDDLLRDMDEATRQGVRRIAAAAVEQHEGSGLTFLLTFVSEQRTKLASFAGTADQTSLNMSLGLLGEVETRARELQRAVGGTCKVTGDPDMLGPIPDCP